MPRRSLFPTKPSQPTILPSKDAHILSYIDKTIEQLSESNQIKYTKKFILEYFGTLLVYASGASLLKSKSFSFLQTNTQWPTIATYTLGASVADILTHSFYCRISCDLFDNLKKSLQNGSKNNSTKALYQKIECLANTSFMALTLLGILHVAGNLTSSFLTGKTTTLGDNIALLCCKMFNSYVVDRVKARTV